ncbi:hypothetical protein [Flavobacterium sp. 5]|uniref:hypothetical protein n=1 Tax=Flavobacterium sp. 5 TaxID=2035199 RepID=UPI000C2C04C7|nr:hypothetical protein [Flavobacterium sp. 5]PKB18562.1 hypothetical protein CLU82_3842 [Flavobacterium sp. 5]
MTTNTILLLLLSLIIAGGLSFFQYLYKVKSKSKVNLLLTFLRFLSVFSLLVLLINPIVTTKKLEIVKTPLPIVIDNSNSISFLNAKEKAVELAQKLTSNSAIQEKFEVQSYLFDTDFRQSDSLSFKGTQTNLDLVAKNLKSVYKNAFYPTVIITDGNQTSGNDYVYSFNENNKVYPLVLGDTTKVLDLKINQLNVNRYAFLKNKFPVEVFLQYSGDKNITANFSISQGNEVLNKQSVSFSASKRMAVVNVLLPANKVGLQVYKAKIESKVSEKNTFNNTKNFAVEVIDQKTTVAIVSSTNHPDIAVLKRAIESNLQHKVVLLKPNDVKSLQDYNVLILYQPTSAFKSIFEANKKANLNTFTVTGTSTDFSFLNQEQNNFVFKMSGQDEDYQANFDTHFNLFEMENIGFENFPPLQNSFGTITPNGEVNVLLSAKIRNIDTKAPLLSFVENQGRRSAYLFGENSWKWNMQSHIDTQSFEKYDIFINKIIQYLASNNAKKSLVVNHESFYNSGETIEITSQYFNKNYDFDEKARLTIAVTNIKTKQTKNYDLLKGNNIYKVNLDGLVAGSYNFSVKELNSKTSYSGHFEILDFDIEKQFVNPDVQKLKQLASQTKGAAFYPDQIDVLIKTLLKNEEYKPVQKDVVTKSPLIDWKWLLVLIAIFLSTEWFVRKYNGML